MRTPWTVSFFNKYAANLTIGSLLRYRASQLREGRGKVGFHDTITLAMKRPARQQITMRPASNDCYTFDEIFVEQVYSDVVRKAPGAATVVDLGANIGFASLYFSAHYPGCRLYCVEPDPENFGILRQNLDPLIQSGRCTAFQGAIWDAEAPLVIAPLERGHVNQFTVHEIVSTDPAATVAAVTMDNVINNSGFDRVGVLKIDVEGAETRVFSGEMSWLERVDAVAVEFHNGSRNACRFDEAMKRHGFDVSDDHGHTVVAVRNR